MVAIKINDTKTIDDAKETTLELELVKKISPETFYYIKGFIHHALENKNPIKKSNH